MTQHVFQTEVTQLLQLMIHSLYSERDIFLRELISNASDACDKLRFLSLTKPELSAGDSDLRVEITADAEAKTLTISDNGVGLKPRRSNTWVRLPSLAPKPSCKSSAMIRRRIPI